jgi:rhodanese-related sulfurtransferase
MVDEANQRIENLAPDHVAAELEHADVLLVDVREAVERTNNGAQHDFALAAT